MGKLAYLPLDIWLYGLIFPFLFSMIIVFFVHPYVVKIAHLKEIVDKPNNRKLHKYPVPVMGGTAVFCGIMVGTGLTSLFFHTTLFFSVLVALSVMLYVGLADDILDLSPWSRIIMEVLLIAFIMAMDYVSMDDFHGLFGIHDVSRWISVPLSLFAGVGIINAINLIDGVNGLSSGLCLTICTIFGIFFAASYDGTMATLCALSAGSLIPFFIHNVFGKTSKMFIGDSGTLMLGLLMVVFCLHIIDNKSHVAYQFPRMGTIAFCLSVLSVPVFDTLRVMLSRIFRGVSPFHPDKTHLHHIFIEVGFSHIGTMISIIGINTLNVLCWFVSYQVSHDPTIQFLVVILTSFFSTTGTYYVIKKMNHERLPYKILTALARKSHWNRGRIFNVIQRFVDKH